MKRIAVIICLVLLFLGCESKKNNETTEKEDNFVLSKVDNSKNYVYSNVIDTYTLPDGSSYDVESIVINLNSEDASNVNMELRSFVKKSNSFKETSDNNLLSGYVYSYSFYVTDDYLSLVIPYQQITNGIYGDEDSLVYVLSMDKGKIISNSDLLERFEMSEKDLFNKVEESIDSEDSLYTMKSIKDNGYYLFVNNDNKLVVLFYEITDEDTIKKELILN